MGQLLKFVTGNVELHQGFDLTHGRRQRQKVVICKVQATQLAEPKTGGHRRKIDIMTGK